MNSKSSGSHNTFGLSHVGLVRKVNEDRQLIRSLGNGRLLMAVADGLGGGVYGMQAAEIAIACLRNMPANTKDLPRSLSRAIQEADSQIRWIVSQNEAMEGMGSTLTAVVIDGDWAHWAHVGDSRLYRLRQDNVVQITTDQNMAQYLVEEGHLTVEAARRHPSQNHLDQCIGCGDCDPDQGRFELEPDDLLVLTTDGMHGGIPHPDFISLIRQKTDLTTKGETLLQSALRAGGDDNITLVMGQI